MAMAEAEDHGFEFLSDPAARFPLPDLGGGDSKLHIEHTQILVCTAAEFSIGDVGYVALTVQVDLNSTCEGLSLWEKISEESSAKISSPGLDEEVYGLYDAIVVLVVRLSPSFE
uniref:Uncharacterized protein n=2 Tax=Aegilops tauschii TaxID=37682 RepID=A0A453BX17_AEGTS|nr:uncharacterized protein LOC109759150 [Aegilops tauschii subsp. strangulata]